MVNSQAEVNLKKQLYYKNTQIDKLKQQLIDDGATKYAGTMMFRTAAHRRIYTLKNRNKDLFKENLKLTAEIKELKKKLRTKNDKKISR